jgi:class 3 adenylate cyclase
MEVNMISQDTLTALDLLIKANPLKALDMSLEHCRVGGVHRKDLKQLEELCLLAILNIAGNGLREEDDDLENEVLDLISGNLPVDQKKTVAICFLRLLQGPAIKWISQMPWRPRVIALLDSQFSGDILSNRGKKEYEGLQAHEKVERLALVVRESEEKCLEALHMLTSLDRVRAHSNALLAAIHSKIGKNLLLPFLPDDINAQLGEMYKRVEMYLDRREDYLSIGDAHSRATREIERIKKSLENYQTTYSRWLLEDGAKKLLHLLNEDFNNNKAAQPGNVSVEARDNKKYPFHLVGQTVDLAFNLKNEGPGYAYDIHVVVLCDDEIELSRNEVKVGTLAPTSMQLIEIPSRLVRECKEAYVLIKTVWNNFDNTECVSEWGITIEAQKSDVDWEALAQTDPYSLDPITSERELIGRRDLLNRLIGTFKASSVGSSIIQGQKRVGKTSLAKALQSHLEGLGYIVLYRMSGDYSSPEAKNAIASLGSVLCNGLIIHEQRIAHLPVPEFTVALSPMAEFLDRVLRILTDVRIVFILDEFDELSPNLYERGTIGDAFFLTIRSLSSRPGIGFVLVGGEKMRHIKECQGDKLNKWNVLSVDYFTRGSDWTDYCDLIQRPVPQLDYGNDSLSLLHDMTAGNPYFTKLICQKIFADAIARRDCHITRKEVERAMDAAISGDGTEQDSVAFQHFWEDGIIEVGEQRAERSIRRRKILIALSDVLGNESATSAKKIIKHPLVHNMEAVDSELREFVSRKVLVEQNDEYGFKVPLFGKWLRGRGVQKLIVTSPDVDAAMKRRQVEEELRIKNDEINAVIEKWGVFRGQDITEPNVRAWLAQFGGIADQRAIFPILQHLRFYTDGQVKKRMGAIHDFVKKGTVHAVERGKQKRSDILVTYIDNSTSNGFNLARQYIEEASIYVGNIVERGKLRDVLSEKPEVKAVVNIVDFVDTADFAATDLISLDSTFADIIAKRQIRVVYAAILALKDGWRRVEETVETLKTQVHTFTCEMLDESAMCFSDVSAAFPDVIKRIAAKNIVQEYGKLLKKNWPIGYGNLGLAVVFERGCPNSSLPVLWAESRANAWVPLFKTEHSLTSHSARTGQQGIDTEPTVDSMATLVRSENFRDWAGSAKVTTAIIFTDIVGSTALGRSLGNEAMKEIRRGHFHQTRVLIHKHGGIEIKTIGDSFMVAFRTAVDAFDFALAIHSETGDDLVSIRAGIHVGPVDIEDEDAFGLMVDYTARVAGMAKGPEIWVSSYAKDHIDQEKARRHQDLVWTCHPNCQLKGVQDSQTLWSVTRPVASPE